MKKSSNKFDVKFAQSSLGMYYNLPPLDDIMAKVQMQPDGKHIKLDPSVTEALKCDIEVLEESLELEKEKAVVMKHEIE